VSTLFDELSSYKDASPKTIRRAHRAALKKTFLEAGAK
jgi:hypothetical protein